MLNQAVRTLAVLYLLVLVPVLAQALVLVPDAGVELSLSGDLGSAAFCTAFPTAASA